MKWSVSALNALREISLVPSAERVKLAASILRTLDSSERQQAMYDADAVEPDAHVRKTLARLNRTAE